MDNTPDKGIVTLMKGIKTHESGGNYNQAPETAGSSLGGAYMYQKPTWQSYAKDTVGDANLPFTPQNQDKVTYLKIKQWKDQGLNPEQIISKWNPGAGQSYVDMVKKAITGNSNQSNTSTQSTGNGTHNTPTIPQNFDEYLKQNQSGTQTPQYTTPQHSPERIAQYQAEQQGLDKKAKDANSFGNIANDTIQGIGDNLSFGGASTLGNQLGTGFAKTTNQIRGLLGGTDNSKYMENMDFGKTTAGLAGTLGGILSVAGGSGELKGIMGAKSAMQAPEVVNALQNTLGKGETIANLSRQDAINALGNTLKEMPTSEVAGKTEQAILKALKELNPTITESKSLVNKLLKGGWDLAKGYALYNLLGNKVGGLIHNVTK